MDKHTGVFSVTIFTRMEAVIFDGKEYIKASVLAKKFRYTADYLGQLCRGKKVDARLVGRAWYINLESLNQHRDSRYKTVVVKNDETPVTVSITKKQSKNYLSRIEVEPILKKKTVSIFKSKDGTLSEFPVKYENDDYSLIPRVNRAAVSKNIPINPAGAEKLKIHKDGNVTTDFKPEDLPEVFLRGTLRVDGLEEATKSLSEEMPDIGLEIKTELKSEPKKDKTVFVRLIKKDTAPVATKEPIIQPNALNPQIKLAIRQFPEQHNNVSKNKPLETRVPVISLNGPKKVLRRSENIVPTAIKPSMKVAVPFATKPQSVALAAPASFKPHLVVKKEKKQIVKEKSNPGWILPLFIIFSACVLAMLLITLNIDIVATKGSYHLEFSLDRSQLDTVVNHLKFI